ncbi:hypothetical protein ACFQV2_04825 [Actinokineospora soli]|uniref:Uncharacterized protein n=1 Tax=Actinokineospora soli TaxID=1048753 RepID=A0ABW2TH87_9PSEU
MPRFSKYAVSSLVATGITQVVLWALYAQASVPAARRARSASPRARSRTS